LILCVCAISKKYLKTKRKTLFGLRFFYLSQGEEREDKRGKTKKEQYTHRINSNLPGESIAREREKKSIVFANRGKSPLFYKKQYKK
jgi:hypothetical protein